MKLIMTKGLPASGKSTWAKEQVRKSYGSIKRINKDDLRDMIDAGKWSKNNEKNILQVRDNIIEDFLNSGISVIVDDTNLAPKHEKRLKQLAKHYNAEFEIKSFLDVPLAECIKRDLSREHSVGERVIVGMFNQFIKPPAAKYKPPQAKPFAILCDIDGTLAHMVDRGPFDWQQVGSDTLDETIAEILRLYYVTEHATVILFSGRDSICRPETEQWLKDNMVPYHQLFMRGQGDMRKDSIVKREMFDAHIKNEYQVLFVLDDRNQVVEMWRDMGLKCLQVAPGDF